MTTIDLQERVSRLASLLAREREALAQFIAELADFDAQRCWEPLGYPSLFEFLTRELRVSRGSAFYRAKAVELVRRFPEVLAALHEGKLCLSCVPEVARVLTEANRRAVLPRFFHLSREDAKLLSVELVPRGGVPAREVVRSVGPAAAALPATPASAPETSRTTPDATPGHPVQQLNCDAPKALGPRDQSLAAAAQPEVAEPLTGQLSRIHLTVSRALLARIEAARLALSHAHPGATIADLLELGAVTALAQDARRKGLVKKPRPRAPGAAPPPPGSRHIPAELRRAVWERDQGCCQWKLASGEICGSRYRLEYDHVEPKARGGETTIANLRLLCQRHNLLAARQAYGESLMRRYRRGGIGPPALRSRQDAAEVAPRLLRPVLGPQGP